MHTQIYERKGEIPLEQDYIEGGVRERLIQAGITELYERGIKDFSLRRVALSAQVSCAAPYRHFKDKSDLISKIVEYIGSMRELFSKEIEEVFKHDARQKVIELAIANLRFWLANPKFRTVLTECGIDGGSESRTLSDFDISLTRAIEEYSRENGRDSRALIFSTRALIYGTVLLIGSGDMKNDSETISLVRARLENDF